MWLSNQILPPDLIWRYFWLGWWIDENSERFIYSEPANDRLPTAFMGTVLFFLTVEVAI